MVRIGPGEPNEPFSAGGSAVAEGAVDASDDAFISKRVVAVIAHRHDQMFMDGDPDEPGGLDDSLGEVMIVSGRLHMTAGVVVGDDDGGGIGQDGGLEDFTGAHRC